VAVFAAILICLVVAGSLLGNSFVTGRMTVAAANKSWLPKFLGVIGHVGLPKESDESTLANEEDAAEAMDKGESPM